MCRVMLVWNGEWANYNVPPAIIASAAFPIRKLDSDIDEQCRNYKWANVSYTMRRAQYRGHRCSYGQHLHMMEIRVACLCSKPHRAHLAGRPATSGSYALPQLYLKRRSLSVIMYTAGHSHTVRRDEVLYFRCVARRFLFDSTQHT